MSDGEEDCLSAEYDLQEFEEIKDPQADVFINLEQAHLSLTNLCSTEQANLLNMHNHKSTHSTLMNLRRKIIRAHEILLHLIPDNHNQLPDNQPIEQIDKLAIIPLIAPILEIVVSDPKITMSQISTIKLDRIISKKRALLMLYIEYGLYDRINEILAKAYNKLAQKVVLKERNQIIENKFHFLVLLNESDDKGHNLLTLATEKALVDIAALLVSAGAHPRRKNKNGHSAEDIAKLHQEPIKQQFLNIFGTVKKTQSEISEEYLKSENYLNMLEQNERDRLAAEERKIHQHIKRELLEETIIELLNEIAQQILGIEEYSK